MLDFNDEEDELDFDLELENNETYVTDNGQYCLLVKTFSENDHIVQYIYNKEDYDEEYGNSYCEGYSEETYYHGKLKNENKFNIKSHKALNNLSTEISRLKEKRDSIYTEINKVNAEHRELINGANKYKIIKNLLAMMDGRKRFIVTQLRWGGFSIYDLNLKEYLINTDDEKVIALHDYQSFELTVSISNTAYASNTYGTRQDEEGCLYSIKAKGVRDKTKDSDTNFDRVYFFDTTDEILEYFNSAYDDKVVNAEKVSWLYNSLNLEVPKKYQVALCEDNLRNLNSNLDHYVKNKYDYETRITNFNTQIEEETQKLNDLKNS